MRCHSTRPSRTFALTACYLSNHVSYATVKRVWPEADVAISSPALTLDECISGSGVPPSAIVAIMVGDLQRIRLYALPPRSFQVAQPIPQAVWAAYQLLVRRGFTMNVVQTDEPLEWEPSWWWPPESH